VTLSAAFGEKNRRDGVVITEENQKRNKSMMEFIIDSVTIIDSDMMQH
jgi:hypothetical protein